MSSSIAAAVTEASALTAVVSDSADVVDHQRRQRLPSTSSAMIIAAARLGDLLERVKIGCC